MGWEENQHFREMVRELLADMKAKEWREGKGLPRLPKGAK